jgi:hypothetical protein
VNTDTVPVTVLGLTHSPSTEWAGNHSTLKHRLTYN